MNSSSVIGYPSISDNYRLGKLPRVRKTMERRLCVGRVWIFLVLGVILIVLGLISIGVYFNIEGLTSSRKYTEILPMYINSASIVISGISVCLLFWKRLKVLVFLCVVICVASGFLCGLTAILTTTHVLKPLQYFTFCRHYESQVLCQCFSPYRRDRLSLEYSDTEETRYDFEDVGSCDSIQTLLPQLLYTLISVYAAVFLVSIGSAIVALLVLRTERIKRGFFRDEAYEEVYTVSGSSSQDQSDSEAEVSPDVNPNPLGENPASVKNSLSRNPINQFETAEISNVVRGRSVTPQNIHNAPAIHDTPSLTCVKNSDELGKESLANKYRIAKTPDRDTNSGLPQRVSKTPDRDITYNIRHRLSKTPDREITRRRRSFTNVKRLSRSCDSLDSSGRESNEKLNATTLGGKKKGKLKEHRRKGKRAATVHTLDTDQLLLILNLQMRYLQETKEQQSKTPRRAVTPQPSSQRPVIPTKVRSHTPQPYICKNRNPNPTHAQLSSQTWLVNRSVNITNSGAKLRSGSESSSRSCERYIEGSRSVDNTNDSANDSDSYCGTLEHNHMVQPKRNINNTLPSIKAGYNPYMIDNPSYHKSADQMHYVTYSDSMLNNPAPKLKSRASAQNYFLPPEPLHRGSYQQLPPQPITRQQNGNKPLPPQPLHRGSSAFQIVDRTSKSRSPSVVGDLPTDVAARKIHTPTASKDYADQAIRENFQLNSRQFILSDTKNKVGVNYEGSYPHDHQADHPVAGYRSMPQSYPAENLPPYSGPPSYKEYVSSCDNSVTSSLSSNPEEIYSFPKKNKKKDKKSKGEDNSNLSRANTSKPDSREENHLKENVEAENVYGNSTLLQGSSTRAESTQESRGPTMEAIYSSPSRSRVKQCIVPENYYAALHKYSKPSDYGRKTNKNLEKNRSTGYQGDFGNSGYQGDFGKSGLQGDFGSSGYQGNYGNSDYQGDFGNSGYQGNYGNSEYQGDFGNSGYQGNFGNSDYQGNYGNIGDYQDAVYGSRCRVQHQIAPDAQYHEYEDVYDTVDAAHKSTQDTHTSMSESKKVLSAYENHRHLEPSCSQPTVYSINTHGLAKTKSKPRSPRTQKSPFPVSNVHVKMPNFTSANSNAINGQATHGVQNVHAENMPNIPRIKLNDIDTEDCIEDEVFVDGNSGEVTEASKSYVNNFGKTNVDEISSGFTHMSIDSMPDLNTTRPTDESAESSDQETETGYMKMCLPHKHANVCHINPTTNENAYNSHLTSDLTNQEDSHMTNDGTRHMPEGEEGEQETTGDQENYEETGV